MSKQAKTYPKAKPLLDNQHARAFKYQAYPTKEQLAFIHNNIGCARKIWNLLHEKTMKDYQEWVRNGKDPNAKPKIVTPAYFKKISEYSFLKNVDSRALVSAQMNYDQAWKSFYSNPHHFGKPDFKSKHHASRSYTTQMINGNIRLVPDSNRRWAWLKLPKMPGLIRVRYHRKIPKTSEIRKVTVRVLPSGKVYVSLLTRSAKPAALPKTNKTIGGDLGINNFLTFNNGIKITNPKHYHQQEKVLTRLQRKLSRQACQAKHDKKKLYEAKNYQKTKLKIARLHEKIKNQRQDYHHKLSYEIVKNNDQIILEDLNIPGMLKNHCLAKSIQDASWGQFQEMLEYKAEWYGKSIIKIDRYFPSSKTCSVCGLVNKKLKLKERSWQCENCKKEHDRDVNAAKNIHDQGISLKGRNCPVSLVNSTALVVTTQEAPTSNAKR
jgi:putative transposase